MHEAKPYGHLLVNGKSVTDAQLAIQTGIPQDQITALIGELENAGVFSRNSNGVIYSRKMTRSAKRSAVNKKNGKSGGNPVLLKPADKPSVDLEARVHIPDITKKEAVKNLIVGSLSSGAKPASKAEIKARWQSKICNWAQHRLTQPEYVKFIAAWTNDEPWAKAKAEEFDKQMRAAAA